MKLPLCETTYRLIPERTDTENFVHKPSKVGRPSFFFTKFPHSVYASICMYVCAWLYWDRTNIWERGFIWRPNDCVDNTVKWGGLCVWIYKTHKLGEVLIPHIVIVKTTSSKRIVLKNEQGIFGRSVVIIQTTHIYIYTHTVRIWFASHHLILTKHELHCTPTMSWLGVSPHHEDHIICDGGSSRPTCVMVLVRVRDSEEDASSKLT